jgi:hypothetical protein
MRNILWIDSLTLKRAQAGWRPVSHPCLLSGREAPTTATATVTVTTVTVVSDEAQGRHSDGRDDGIDKQRATESNRGTKRERDTASTADDALASSLPSSVDSARERYLARKRTA